MPKKSKDVSPLTQYWLPPDSLIENGVGKPWACLATTFEFDAAFFEAELLPRFLGLKFDHTENEPSFLVEREDALALSKVAILVDQSRLDPTQTTMRWDQIPVRVPGGILHAKITLLAWERFLRVIVGSANLTRYGYRRNREIFAALDFWNDPDSVPRSVLSEVLDVLLLALDWSGVAPAVRARSRETIERIRQKVGSWETVPEEFAKRERPRVTLAITRPAADQRLARSTIEEVVSLWGNRKATSVAVVTPFVGQHKPSDKRDAVIEKLMEVPRSRDCDAWLVIPRLPKGLDEEKPHVPIPRVIGEAWSAASLSPRTPHVLPLPLCVEGVEDRNRDLHSKALLLESDDETLMMIGSSNFTPHGMGLGAHNLEANLVFEDRNNERRDGLPLYDRLQLPLDWDDALAVTDVVWLDPVELPEDEADSAKALPPFFAWAVYSQKTGELKLTLNREKSEPPEWSVRLPGGTADVGLALFARTRLDPAAQADSLTHVFSGDARAVTIVALAVDWIDPEGRPQRARISVCAEDQDALLAPTEYRQLSAEAIIECLMSGKSPSQWYDQQLNSVQRGSNTDAAIESLRAVDTSGYLLYRVRRFGRALTGMCDRIVRTVPHPDAIRYRLLKDPFGPLSLADTILVVREGENGNWCAQLEREHKMFLLTEILLAVNHLRRRFRKSTSGPDRRQLTAHFDEVEKRLAELMDNIHLNGESLPTNLQSYMAAVRSRTSQQAVSLAEGEEDAC